MKTKALIKKLNKAVNIPEYKTNGSSGLDLEAFLQNELIVKSNETVLVPTGLSIAIDQSLEIQKVEKVFQCELKMLSHGCVPSGDC